jgi:hypothetical protein
MSTHMPALYAEDGQERKSDSNAVPRIRPMNSISTDWRRTFASRIRCLPDLQWVWEVGQESAQTSMVLPERS